jgi:hypothetical protein
MRLERARISRLSLNSLVSSSLTSVWADEVGIRIMLGIGGAIFVLAGLIAQDLLVPLMGRNESGEVSPEVVPNPFSSFWSDWPANSREPLS